MDRKFKNEEKKILHSLLGRIYDVIKERPNLEVVINIRGYNDVSYDDNSIFVSLGSEKYHKVINGRSIQLMRNEIVKNTYIFPSVGITLQSGERKHTTTSSKQIVSSIYASTNGKNMLEDHNPTHINYKSDIPRITTNHSIPRGKRYRSKSPIIRRKRKISAYQEKLFNKRKNDIIKKILEQGNGTGTHTH